MDVNVPILIVVTEVVLLIESAILRGELSGGLNGNNCKKCYDK